jgi:hypothetical protein
MSEYDALFNNLKGPIPIKIGDVDYLFYYAQHNHMFFTGINTVVGTNILTNMIEGVRELYDSSLLYEHIVEKYFENKDNGKFNVVFELNTYGNIVVHLSAPNNNLFASTALIKRVFCLSKSSNDTKAFREFLANKKNNDLQSNYEQLLIKYNEVCAEVERLRAIIPNIQDLSNEIERLKKSI